MPTTRFRRFLFVGFTVLFTLAFATSAFAAPPQITTFHLDIVVNPDPVFSSTCGFPIATQWVGTFTTAVHVNKDGNPVFEIDTSPSFRTTFTNPANGTSFSTPNVTMNKTTFTQDGMTGTFVTHGLAFRIVVPGQGVVFLATGRAVFDQDGNLISIAGVNDAATGNFAGLCSALAAP